MSARVFLIVLAFVITTSTKAATVEQPIDVSLVQLIATPERFQNKLVRVVAFLHTGYEENALYLHKEDYSHFLSKNGIWLRLFDGGLVKSDTAIALSDKYVVAIGTFIVDDKGHFDGWSGALTNLQELVPWIKE